MPPCEKSCSCPMAGEDSRQPKWAFLQAIAVREISHLRFGTGSASAKGVEQ